jgi:DNA polymerase (family 10)
MPLDRGAAADALDEIAELLELRGENPFRVRAFANGARLVRGLGDFDARLAAGTLTEVKGIGKGLVGELEAMAASGTSPLLEELRAAVPAGLIEIRRVPGLGPKKARTLYEELAVHSLADLEKACREDRLRTLKGFGAKTQEKVLEALEAIRGNAGMLRRDEAQAHAGRMEGAVRAAGGSLLIAGAFRRGETLCDGLDLVLVAEDPGRALQEAFGILPPPGSETRGFLLQRDRPSFIQRDGPRETRVWPTAPGNAAATLWRATGPAGHVDAGMARTKGNEGMSGLDGASDEAGLYEAIGSSYIPPELRGDGSEFALAARGALPVLLERSAIRGAVHSHTNWSDGSGTVAEMFDAALATGLSWLGNSDHSSGSNCSARRSSARRRRARASPCSRAPRATSSRTGALTTPTRCSRASTSSSRRCTRCSR